MPPTPQPNGNVEVPVVEMTGPGGLIKVNVADVQDYKQRGWSLTKESQRKLSSLQHHDAVIRAQLEKDQADALREVSDQDAALENRDREAAARKAAEEDDGDTE